MEKSIDELKNLILALKENFDVQSNDLKTLEKDYKNQHKMILRKIDLLSKDKRNNESNQVKHIHSA